MGERALQAQVDALLLALGTLHGICADRWPGHRLMLPLGGGRDGIRVMAESEYRRLLAESGLSEAAPLPWFPAVPDWFADDGESARWEGNVARVEFPSGKSL